MKTPPEQSIVNYLEASGYKSDAIIAYLEVSANAGRFEFAEGEYDNLDFAVCERPDGTRYGTAGACNPETGKEVTDKPKAAETAKAEGKKREKPDKTLDELKQEKMKKTAEKQGSDPTNNRKVMIDGKGYGWAQKGGKWIMVPWGSVAGIKKVGPKKQEKPKRNNRGRGRGRSGSRNESGYIQGLREALDKQTNDAGREAIMDLIRDAGATV